MRNGRTFQQESQFFFVYALLGQKNKVDRQKNRITLFRVVSTIKWWVLLTLKFLCGFKKVKNQNKILELNLKFQLRSLVFKNNNYLFN
jgi:hypothetical protein